MNHPPLIFKYGGGTNTVALACWFREQGIRPDRIQFSDTGGERPETYEHVAMMDGLMQSWWGIGITRCYPTRAGEPITLEQDCLNKGLMPSISYGLRGCSQRFKHEPMEKDLKAWAKEHGVTEIVSAIGYAADEMSRVVKAPTSSDLLKNLRETYRYPLVEAGWRFEECVEAIKRHGLPLPGKSACFFCAATTVGEVLKMRVTHPELIARALVIEDKAQAKNKHVRGLGGENNLWRDWLAADASQMKLLLDVEPVHLPCGCYDGKSACAA